MNLLVASSGVVALCAIQDLGLDDKTWRPVGFGEGLGAPRCERVVVLRPWGRSYNEAELAYIERLQLTLPPGRRVAFV